MKTLLLFLLVNGTLTACEVKDWKSIGVVSGNDVISLLHISNLLRSHGIRSSSGGSIVYDIYVPPVAAGKASQLLRADARKHGYWVGLEKDDVLKAAEPKERVTRAAVATVLGKPEYSDETALGRFLRSTDIAVLTAKYPYVTLSVHERQYLATPKVFRTGYDVEIALQNSIDDPDKGYRGSYQVYDDGRELQFQGSSEWESDAPKKDETAKSNKAESPKPESKDGKSKNGKSK
jgi:hypothetical protein